LNSIFFFFGGTNAFKNLIPDYQNQGVPMNKPKTRVEINANYQLVGKKITATLIDPVGDGENKQYEANQPSDNPRERISGLWIETNNGLHIYANSQAVIPIDAGGISTFISISCDEKPSPPIGNFPLPNRYFSVLSDTPAGGHHEHTDGVISIVSLEPGGFNGSFDLRKDSDGNGIDIKDGRFELVFA
jgi:hypothetical protein